MSRFFIDTNSGQIATQAQLIEHGIAGEQHPPPPPWHPLQGTTDASTAVHAVMRKRIRGRRREAWIGTTCIRHGDYKASLELDGWEEVSVEEIRCFGDR